MFTAVPNHRRTLTPEQAEAFFALPDRSRVSILKRLDPRERESVLISLAVALADGDDDVQELAA